jgi:pullulanase/glycogen debranching enzyme
MSLLDPRTTRKVTPGRFYPLGATLEPDGTNFALYSRNATDVFLLFFHRDGGEPTDVIRLENRTRFVFHAFVQGVRAGQLYGYRVRGPFDPKNGLRFNENKHLVDPYAKALSGKPRNEDNLLLGYDPLRPRKTSRSTDATTRASYPRPSSSTTPSTGRATPRRTSRSRRRSSTRCTSRASPRTRRQARRCPGRIWGSSRRFHTWSSSG